jgi:hypothetical protein
MGWCGKTGGGDVRVYVVAMEFGSYFWTTHDLCQAVSSCKDVFLPTYCSMLVVWSWLGLPDTVPVISVIHFQAVPVSAHTSLLDR